MSGCTGTESRISQIRAYIWLIVACIKLYIIGAYTLVKELWDKSTKSLPKCTSEDGLVAIVTGGASGIGYQATRNLAKRNIRVIIASRCVEEAAKAIINIKAEVSTATVDYFHLDLSSLKSVEEFVQNFLDTGLPLHILINNAGVMLVPYHLTEDGFESHFQVNYLSHLYLTSLLIGHIKASASPARCARIVNISSAVHYIANFEDISSCCEDHYSPHATYAASKLAIIMASHWWSEKLRGRHSHVTVNCLHPGVINSSLYANIHWSVRWIMDLMRLTLFRTTEQAGESIIYAALSENIEGHSGMYYDNTKAVQSHYVSYSKNYQSELMTKSFEMLNVDPVQMLA